MKDYFVYIMTNNHENVMYVGVTNNLERRVLEHQSGLIKGFTQKYNLKKLVYFEQTSSIEVAIIREKEIKKWRRDKKDALVRAINPDFKDLSVA